jgi:alpha-galactosidase
MALKIGFIGAGSAVYAVNVIKDICLTPRLTGATVTLMDIDAAKLDTAHELCRRYAEEVGMKLNLEKTTSRQKCLQGADFVINTALAAGHQRLIDGFRIARKHGYRFAGSKHVMYDEAFWVDYYQLELMDSIARDVVKHCPKAWLLMVANPVMSGTTYLIRRHPKLKMVGLCHGFASVYGYAEMAGIPKEGLDFECIGVNHFVWLTKLRSKGKDVYPKLKAWAAKHKSKAPKQIELWEKWGALPIGDTEGVSGGAMPYWYHLDTKMEKAWKQETAPDFWNGFFHYSLGELKQVRKFLSDKKASVVKRYGTSPSGEPMIPLVESVACNIPRSITVNIANAGRYVEGIPEDFAVELQAKCDRRGVHGVKTGGLPKPILAWTLRDQVAPVDLELEAHERGDRELLLDLICMDPWTRSRAQAEALLKDIFALPYHQALRRHYGVKE